MNEPFLIGSYIIPLMKKINVSVLYIYEIKIEFTMIENIIFKEE